MSEFSCPGSPPAPSSKAAARAQRRAEEWRAYLGKSFAQALQRARDPAEQDRIWKAYEQELESGPDFIGYHAGSQFREAPRISFDRNALTRLRVQLLALANGSWATKAKGKHAGLVQPSTLRVFDALCGLARKYGRAFPSHKGLAYLAKCSKNTVISALKVLEFFGFLTIHRRLKRVHTALGLRTVQDTNAYALREPGSWVDKALALFARPPRASESNSWQASYLKFTSKGGEAAKATPWGLATGQYG